MAAAASLTGTPQHRRRHLMLPLVLLLAAWAGGFAWFALSAARPFRDPPSADGIVALTGGADRVETALRLLAERRAPLLLVSGVGGAAEFAGLARRAGVDPALSGRVTLGRAATSTRGNAVETANWAQAHGIRSLIVVTAGYHMPRATVELSRALPGVALYPAAVVPSAMRGWHELGSIRLLAGEYAKWLAAEAGLSALGGHGDDPPHPEPDRDAPHREQDREAPHHEQGSHG